MAMNTQSLSDSARISLLARIAHSLTYSPSAHGIPTKWELTISWSLKSSARITSFYIAWQALLSKADRRQPPHRAACVRTVWVHDQVEPWSRSQTQASNSSNIQNRAGAVSPCIEYSSKP